MALVVTSITLLTTNSQAEENKPKVRRPKPSFFEQERKPRFGFGDFLNSALDGSDNFLSADNSVKTLLAPGNQNQFYNATNPGTLTVVSRDENSTDFLKINLDGGSILNFNLRDPKYNGDPRIGTIKVDNLTSNIAGLTGVTNFQYRGSFSVNGNLVSGAVLLIDPKNPQQSIFIQLPARNIPNVNDENTPISAPVFFNIGFPSDR